MLVAGRVPAASWSWELKPTKTTRNGRFAERLRLTGLLLSAKLRLSFPDAAGTTRPARLLTGVKSRRSWLLAIFVAAGCSQPQVDARAVWLDGEIAEDGSRTLHAYAHGVTTDYRILNRAQTAADEQLVVALSPDGRGALVRALPAGVFDQLGSDDEFRIAYLDFATHRVLPIAFPVSAAAEQTLGFSPQGDILLWHTDEDPTFWWVSLSGELTTQDGVIQPNLQRRYSGGLEQQRTRAIFAADTNIVFHIEVDPAGVALPGGHVIAERYTHKNISEQALGFTTLSNDFPLGSLSTEGCTDRQQRCELARVDPDGHGITVQSVEGSQCLLQRWSWQDEPGTAPICVLWNDGPPELVFGELIAAISPSQYVFVSGQGITIYDWVLGDVKTRPWIVADNRIEVHTSRDGRRVVAVSPAGPILAASEDGIEVVNIEQINCDVPQPMVVSPNGQWAAWVCSSAPSGFDLETEDTATVVRVSAAGLEQHQGVPMWVSAIDDHGDLMMWSRTNPWVLTETKQPPDAPRNLYILGADQSLARAQTLEPDPVLSYGLDMVGVQWIAAQPL